MIYTCNKCKGEFTKDKMKVGSRTCCKACNNKDKKQYWANLDKHEKRDRSARRYGITKEIFDKMFSEQEGKCKICDTNLIIPEANERPANRACVDHNHDTGEVRGLLCAPCNSGLGMFKDNIEIMSKAIGYLHG